mgnify:CR=1 FL=1
MDETLRMLKELTDAPGVPGFEREARLVMERYLEPLADEVSRDRLGSVIGRKRGTADEPRIMLAGHLDEVGFMVSLITDQGFIRFQPLGGWWDQVLLAQRVVIKTHKGDVVGVIGSKPPHVLSAEERKKVVEKKDMFIDIGASSKEEAMEMGVRLGDPIIPVSDFTVMNNEKYLMAKAWDNRVGCALAIEVLKRLQGQDHPNTVYGVGTVQEEVGLRGAMVSAYGIVPDAAIAVDVGFGAAPGLPEDDVIKMGRGPAIALGANVHPQLHELLVETARLHGIPHQIEPMPAGSGTDAWAVQVVRSGVPTAVVSIPLRYMHSSVEVVDIEDVRNTARLLAHAAAALREEDVKGWTYDLT